MAGQLAVSMVVNWVEQMVVTKEYKTVEWTVVK
jgi:hypothetical protein